MVNFLRLVFFLLAARVAHAIAHNSCRQCNGLHKFLFTSYVTPDAAKSFLKASIGSCATGAELDIASYTTDVCQGDACKYYYFTINVWRYCGNGGSVIIKRKSHCIAGVCNEGEYLGLTCTQSVVCHGDCNCAQCGC